MEGARFDALARGLTAPDSRRRILAAALGVGTFGLLGLALPSDAVGKKRKKRKKRKKKHKRPKPNAFGCLSVGVACKNAGQCCSGICEGKKKRKCRAHGAGTCDQEAPGLCTTPTPSATACNNRSDCPCIRTTAGSNFCADLFVPGGSRCGDCTKDADCQGPGMPPGMACAPFSIGNCAGICSSGMACMAPCGTATPDP